MFFVTYSCKTGKCWSQNCFTEVDQRSNGINRICQILILTLLTCDPALFPTKNSPKIQKVMIFSCIGPCFWHIWIAQWLKLFCGDGYFFLISAVFMGKWVGEEVVWGEVKVGPRMQTFDLSIFHKKLKSFKTKKFECFCLL